MLTHATIPGLPPSLWQAAFFVDLLRRKSRKLSQVPKEMIAMAAYHSEAAERVIEIRKRLEARGHMPGPMAFTLARVRIRAGTGR